MYSKRSIAVIVGVLISLASGALFVKNKTTGVQVANTSTTPKQILLVPLGSSVSRAMVDEAYQRIRSIIPGAQLLQREPMPQVAYYKPRNRHRADSLIHILSRRAKPHQIYLGLTNQDISTTKGSYADWGVMGLGFCPGRAAVASSFRLKNKQSFWKVAIHELGHTAGLPHCPTPSCLMRDAKGGDPTAEEKAFCNKCKTVLIRQGWRL